MWRDASTYAAGERSKSEFSVARSIGTVGQTVSMEGSVGGVRATNLVLTGFTAAATIFGLANDLSAQTLRTPNFSATANIFSPCDRLAVSIPRAFQAAMKEMSGFKLLSPGWDGAGSVAPKGAVVDAALNFLNVFPFDFLAPEASASADGAVSWFWNTKAVYAAVSFSSANRFAFYAKNKRTGAKVRGIGALDQSVPQELLDVIKAA